MKETAETKNEKKRKILTVDVFHNTIQNRRRNMNIHYTTFECPTIKTKIWPVLAERKTESRNLGSCLKPVLLH